MNKILKSIITTLLYIVFTLFIFNIIFGRSTSGDSGLIIVVLIIMTFATSIAILIINLIMASIMKPKIQYNLLAIILKQSMFELSSLFTIGSICLFGIFDKENISLENTNTVFSLSSLISLILVETVVYLYENRKIYQQPTTKNWH